MQAKASRYSNIDEETAQSFEGFILYHHLMARIGGSFTADRLAAELLNCYGVDIETEIIKEKLKEFVKKGWLVKTVDGYDKNYV